jgi:LysM repeat protein
MKNQIQKIKNFLKNNEDNDKPISIKSAFYVVCGLHLLAIGGIIFFSSMPKSNAQTIKSDKDFLSKLPEVGVELAEATPTPTPTPLPKVVRELPKEIDPAYPQKPIENKVKPKIKTEYIVQRGDTFYSICNKYKLNKESLKKINGIKDENKIYVGQKLKFM